MERLNAGAIKLGLEPSSRQLEQFHTYYQELVDWNKRVNLTRITSYEDVQIKHFLDSLTVSLAWPSLKTSISLHLIDVGTGAGMPGIPLKILFPDIKLVLLEAASKRAAFLRNVSGKLGLDNVEIIVGRAEDIAHDAEYREKFANPYIAASRGFIDDVIEPRETRPRLVNALEMVANKRDANPAKKHGNIPL